VDYPRLRFVDFSLPFMIISMISSWNPLLR